MTRTITEHHIKGYPARTKENVLLSDMTIAIAQDFNTAGEKLTYRLCDDYRKPIMRVYIRDTTPTIEQCHKIEQWCIYNTMNISTVNIAGNGLYSIPYTQEQCNKFVLDVLILFCSMIKVNHIRSGGQTGIDTAGIWAAEALHIPWTVLAPKGWVFRDANGVDISDEKKFKERFPRICSNDAKENNLWL